MKEADRSLWTVVFNPRAGRNTLRREKRLKRALVENGLHFEWISCRHRDEAIPMIHQAIADGCRHILAVGGDGTNNQTINAISSQIGLHEITYALLPWGTGNDWAADHGLTRDPGRLSLRMKEPVLKSVELGRIEFSEREVHLFTNTLGVGFDAFVVSRLENSGKIGRVSYLLEIVRSLRLYDSHDVIWELEKGIEKGPIFSLHIGLGPTTGGGMKITPHAVDRRKELAYTVVMDAPKRHYLRAIPNLLTGKIEGLSFTRTGFSPRFTVPEQDLDTLVECDGEICGHAPFRVMLNDCNLNLLDTSV